MAAGVERKFCVCLGALAALLQRGRGKSRRGGSARPAVPRAEVLLLCRTLEKVISIRALFLRSEQNSAK